MKGRNLSFELFQKTNALRCEKGFKHGVKGWPIEIWALAIAGEAGELCNIIKKVIRGDATLAEKRKEIVREIADVITYCDLAMSCLDADTGEELTEKFNEVSKRQNCGVLFTDMPGAIEKARPSSPLTPEETRMRDACFHDMLHVVKTAWNDTEAGAIDGREALRILYDAISQTREGFGYDPKGPILIVEQQAGSPQ